MRPVIQDTDLALYQGDCLDVLRGLPSESVHMCATSPPFFNLRDYGTGEWEGGNPKCDHLEQTGGTGRSTLGAASGGNDMSSTARERSTKRSFVPYRGKCGKCGAVRIDHQIGLEDTPEEWARNLVEIFREMRRVLRNDGVFWLEVGDKYDNKMLLGAPWTLAFALRDDGWKLRSEVIWDKPDAMPESALDRPTRSHSNVFLFSKSSRYFYDEDAIREPFKTTQTEHGRMRDARPQQSETLDGSDGEAPRGPDGRRKTTISAGDGGHENYLSRDGKERWPNPNGANARSVWRIVTGGTAFEHFAPWPRKLIAQMILAGTSEHGCCADCGAPYDRIKGEATLAGEKRIHGSRPAADERGVSPTGLARSNGRTWREREMLGWGPTCSCATRKVVPAIVLDPFLGSGTTCLVARSLGRHSIGIELSEHYLREIAAPRLSQLSLLT